MPLSVFKVIGARVMVFLLLLTKLVFLMWAVEGMLQALARHDKIRSYLQFPKVVLFCAGQLKI
jgi:hypothetical protein